MTLVGQDSKVKPTLATQACRWCGSAAMNPVCAACEARLLDGVPFDSALGKILLASAVPAAGPRFRSGGDAASPLMNKMFDRAAEIGALEPAGPAKFLKTSIAVLFTDIQDSTAYMYLKGDLKGAEMRERHNSALCPVIQANQGAVVEIRGDSIMGCFKDPTTAANAAVEMQRSIDSLNSREPDPSEHLRVRMGIHYGETIMVSVDPASGRPTELCGTLVNVAARIEAMANGGEILTSADLVEKLDAPMRPKCETLGRRELKGIPLPIELFRIRWE